MQLINPSSQILASCRRLGFVLLLAAGLALGCSDNATKLSYAIEESLETSPFTTGRTVHDLLYVPKSNPQLPYYLVFFPEHRVEQKELEAAGLPRPLASRIYAEMAYVSVGNTPFLVVVQDGGKINFTTHWHRFASVPEILVIPGEGPVTIHLTPGKHGALVERAK